MCVVCVVAVEILNLHDDGQINAVTTLASNCSLQHATIMGRSAEQLYCSLHKRLNACSAGLHAAAVRLRKQNVAKTDPNKVQQKLISGVCMRVKRGGGGEE